VVNSLRELLCAHDIEVTVCSWPPNVEGMKNKSVISFLDMEQPFLCNLDRSDFGALRQVALRCARLFWVCQDDDPHIAVAIGWLRVLQSENVNRQYQHLTLEEAADRPTLDLALAIVKVVMAQTDEREFVERDKSYNIPRWSYDLGMTRTIADSTLSHEVDSVRLGNVAPGSPLRMLHGGDPKYAHFVPDTPRLSHLAADKVEVELKCVNITHHDLVDPGTHSLREASGVIKAVGSDVSLLRPGDNVCLSFFGHLSTSVILDGVICQKIPAGVNMVEAACVPITLATALRALIDIAGVKPQHNVLVQAGGTKIGRAAVLLASATNAFVYATARNAEEVKSLVALGISTQNILTDNDPLLPAATKILTNDRGWDIIIRTAKTVDETCVLPKCIADFGAIVDVFPSSNIDCIREMTISIMGIGSLRPEDPVLMQKTMSRIANYLPQLSTLANSFDVFPSSAAPAALERHKMEDEHRGVILSFDQDDIVQVSPSAKNTMQLHRDATYIMAGGLGGLGRSLARLLVDNGARNLVFLSRAGPNTTAAKALVNSMAGLGVTVKTLKCDISDEESVATALTECSTMPPIRGVIQAATVIQDSIFDNYTLEQWQANLRPKVQGSWNLHRQLPEDMDFFVMLSSIVGLVGHQGQAGYAAGNTFQDSLALYRQRRGLPAVTIDLGAMLDVGTIMEGTTAADFSSSDVAWMKEVDLHKIMTMCISNEIDGYAIPAQVCTGLPSGGMLQLGQHEKPLYFEKPFFAALKHLGTTATNALSVATPVDGVTDFIYQLANVDSLDDAESYTAEILRAHLAAAVQRAVDDIDVSEPLHSYGIDSLMAVKLRTWIGERMKADVTLFDILNAKSMQSLA
jgi:NADPH:quinone reductase-like Zn-dependent oxidoreductase/short-subunit dehydrogenase/aryl carrier-like protein